MRFVGFIGPSYQLNSRNVDCQRCVNLYPELDEIGTGKEREVAALVSTPGLRLLNSIGDGPIRGEWHASNGRYFVISKDTLYEIDDAWNGTSRGTLTTTSGPVSMDDSGLHLAIVDGSVNGFMLTFADNTYAAIPFPSDINFVPFAGCDQVAFQDGYFIYIHKGTGQFFISGLVGSTIADETTIDPLDFASADGSPDILIGVLSDHRDLWLFGKKSVEVWFNSGGTTTVDGNLEALFPFSRNQGAYVEQGCAALFSIAKMNNTVFWLGADERGNGMVYMANGYQPQRISTHAVEQAIQSYGDISDAVAYTYQKNGHHFYVLNFTSANTTWVYDTTTSLWHERTYTNDGQLERHRANGHAFAFDTHVVGDYQNGNIYELTGDLYSDNGSAITRMRVSPHVSQDMSPMTYDSFQLDIESGVGIDGIGQGTDPQIMLQFSDDGGHSWSNEKWTSFGKIGKRKPRALWRRLGQSRDRVFKVVITDPVKVTLMGAEINAVEGTN